jgi:hypothetical protein
MKIQFFGGIAWNFVLLVKYLRIYPSQLRVPIDPTHHFHSLDLVLDG